MSFLPKWLPLAMLSSIQSRYVVEENSLGSLDSAKVVNKLQRSVKNIEKNFDRALGLEDKAQSNNEASASCSTNTKALFDPVMSFMGHKMEEDMVESKDSKSP